MPEERYESGEAAEEQRRVAADKAAFMAATKGATAWVVAVALSNLTPGIDWRRCSRGHMAEAWAKARAGDRPYHNDELDKLTLAKIVKRVNFELKRKGLSLLPKPKEEP